MKTVGPITRIELYLTGIDETSFRAQSLIQDGVIRQLEIVGEAVKRISPATRSMAPLIPWAAIARMRDKLIHDYFGVDLDQGWLTATTDVPILKGALGAVLTTLSAGRENP